ncbi:MAG: hypothetical protein AAFZ52_16810, partial [Bacteroidota bacterium]
MTALLNRILLFSLLFVAFDGLFAQRDYQLFRPGVQYLYEQPFVDPPPLVSYSREEPHLLGMLLDADGCAEAYSSLDVATDYCVSVVPSFAGYRVCQGMDSTWLDCGEHGRLLLLPGAKVSAEWTALQAETGAIRARVTELAEEDFLGSTDSVKSITLYYADSNAPIGAPIRISKQYSLISGKFFWNLAAQGEDELPLVGLGDPERGLQNFTAEDVLDVQLEDEWHYQTT